MNQEIQENKEKAMSQAALLGLGLNQADKSIIGVDLAGSYYLVCHSFDYDSLWQDAFNALANKQPALISKAEAEKTFRQADAEERDLKRRMAINLAISKGYTIFHRGSKLIGLNR